MDTEDKQFEEMVAGRQLSCVMGGHSGNITGVGLIGTLLYVNKMCINSKLFCIKMNTVDLPKLLG